jgi:phage tail-like protein
MTAVKPDTVASPGRASAGAQPGAIVDPLAELTFKVVAGSRVIGRFAECSGLAAEYDVTDYVEGGNNEYVHRLRGVMRFPNVTLKRGVTTEDGLLAWFYAVETSTERPTVNVILVDELAHEIRTFNLLSALPVRWTGPSVSAGGNGAATESLEIAHLGFV